MLEVKLTNTEAGRDTVISKEVAEQHIREIFEYIGEDPNRIGLLGTPDRIIRMWQEIFRGYDPQQNRTSQHSQTEKTDCSTMK